MLSAVLMLALQTSPYPADMKRAEICYAHVMVLIDEAARETGRVAGPSWFIRDWWGAKLNEAQSQDDRQAAVKTAVEQRKAQDPERFAAERTSCMQQAIRAGAVP